jgi:hypothetical protein
VAVHTYEENTVTVADKTVLVTEANRDIGKALVDVTDAARTLERQMATLVAAEPVNS